MILTFTLVSSGRIDAYFKNSRTKQNNYWAKEEQDILGEQADRYYLVKIAIRKI